jgi:hypothetical protein
MAATPDRVDDDVLDDLRTRLRARRTVALAGPTGWQRGVDPDYLADLVAYGPTATTGGPTRTGCGPC